MSDKGKQKKPEVKHPDFSIVNKPVDINNQPRGTYDIKRIRGDIARKMRPLRGK